MTWHDDMKRDAVKVAFPDWELRDDDAIEFNVSWDEGYSYSSYTYEDPSFEISITVYRAGVRDQVPYLRSCEGTEYNNFRNEEAREFFTKLMEEASK